MDEKIAQELRSKGYQADVGPETMMPPTAQVLVIYDDQWSWDFKYHLTSLSIRFRNARSQGPIAYSEYAGPASLTDTPEHVVARVIKDLLKSPKASPAAH